MYWLFLVQRLFLYLSEGVIIDPSLRYNNIIISNCLNDISCSHNQVIIKSIWSIIRRYWIGKQDDILPYDYCHAKQWWFVSRNNLLWMFSFANYIDVIFYIDHLECEPLKNLRRVSEHGEPRYMRVYDN